MSLRVLRREVTPERIAALSSCPPVLARAYAARGIEQSQQLGRGLERLLPVSTLEGVEAAVALLLQHRAGRILVIGDYDADGATSSALIVRALRACGFASVDFLVPNRFEFGYGLTPEIVALAAERSPTLLITVDNGISSLAGVSAARALGIDVLVTDHHLAGAQLPSANVIVNPNLPQSSFGSKALADQRLPSPASWLDLVALGTVADVVPFDENNRRLVAQGLARIRAGRCTPGVRALIETGGRRPEAVIASDLGFAAGPRLNAAGRLDDMSLGVRCLLTDSLEEARSLAEQLDALNRERRSIEAKMQEEALAAVRHLKEPGRDRRGLCLYDPGWHQGVVGLVAGRIKERLRRPVIAFADAGDGLLRGSARSVNGVHVRDVLEAIATRSPDLLGKFGGHAMAAGLTLERARLDEFAREFDAEVTRWQSAGSLADVVETDGELSVEEISLATAELVREAGPWGQGFPEPCFDQHFRIERTRIVGEKHLKLWVSPQGSARRFDAIAFNYSESLGAGQLAHLVYRLDINEYAGERRLQLIVDHVLAVSA